MMLIIWPMLLYDVISSNRCQKSKQNNALPKEGIMTPKHETYVMPLQPSDTNFLKLFTPKTKKQVNRHYSKKSRSVILHECKTFCLYYRIYCQEVIILQNQSTLSQSLLLIKFISYLKYVHVMTKKRKKKKKCLLLPDDFSFLLC
jgi:hypothetical protein